MSVIEDKKSEKYFNTIKDKLTEILKFSTSIEPHSGPIDVTYENYRKLITNLESYKKLEESFAKLLQFAEEETINEVTYDHDEPFYMNELPKIRAFFKQPTAEQPMAGGYKKLKQKKRSKRSRTKSYKRSRTRRTRRSRRTRRRN